MRHNDENHNILYIYIRHGEVQCDSFVHSNIDILQVPSLMMTIWFGVPFRSIPFGSIRFWVRARSKSLTATWHLGTFAFVNPQQDAAGNLCMHKAHTHTQTHTEKETGLSGKFSSWAKVTWHAYKLSAIKFALTFWPCSGLPYTPFPLYPFHLPLFHPTTFGLVFSLVIYLCAL